AFQGPPGRLRHLVLVEAVPRFGVHVDGVALGGGADEESLAQLGARDVAEDGADRPAAAIVDALEVCLGQRVEYLEGLLTLPQQRGKEVSGSHSLLGRLPVPAG